MKKIYVLMMIGNLISFLCVFLINNYMYTNVDVMMNSTLIIMIPFIICMGMIYVYGFMDINDKFKKIRIYTNIHSFILAIGILILLLTRSIDKQILNPFIILFCILSVIFQIICIIKLIKKGFDYKHEKEMILRIEKEYKSYTKFEKIKKYALIVQSVYIFLSILRVSNYVFGVILIIGSIIITICLIKMCKEYLKIDYIKNKETIPIFVVYYVCVILAFVIYIYMQTIAPFFLLLSVHGDSLIRNKIIKKKYLEIENLGIENMA